jgi:hypothetical protein
MKKICKIYFDDVYRFYQLILKSFLKIIKYIHNSITADVTKNIAHKTVFKLLFVKKIFLNYFYFMRATSCCGPKCNLK